MPISLVKSPISIMSYLARHTRMRATLVVEIKQSRFAITRLHEAKDMTAVHRVLRIRRGATQSRQNASGDDRSLEMSGTPGFWEGQVGCVAQSPNMRMAADLQGRRVSLDPSMPIRNGGSLEKF